MKSRPEQTPPRQNTNQSKNIVKIKWDKTDKDYYSALVREKNMDMSKELDLRYKCNLELDIQGFTDILIETAQQTTKEGRKLYRKPKLNVWTVEISNALRKVRDVNKQIQNMDMLNIKESNLFHERKYLKKKIRRACRIKVAKRADKEKV